VTDCLIFFRVIAHSVSLLLSGVPPLQSIDLSLNKKNLQNKPKKGIKFKKIGSSGKLP
jgi:hypothetical protein